MAEVELITKLGPAIRWLFRHAEMRVRADGELEIIYQQKTIGERTPALVLAEQQIKRAYHSGADWERLADRSDGKVKEVLEARVDQEINFVIGRGYVNGGQDKSDAGTD
jgi:hypothetical protein